MPEVLKPGFASIQRHDGAMVSGSEHCIIGKSDHNWAEIFDLDLDQFRYLETIQDVMSLVNSNNKMRCRAGTLHSCPPLILSQGIIMSLTNMDKITANDVEQNIVKCQAGARIHDFCAALASYNLAIGMLGRIRWQTISGAIMTGTHHNLLTTRPKLSAVRSWRSWSLLLSASIGQTTWTIRTPCMW